MGKLVVGTFLTLDGVMQAPGGPDEDRDGGFEHGGWSFTYWDDMMGEVVTEWTLQAEALLLGRRRTRSSRPTGRTPVTTTRSRRS
jgi:hypothetical protein